MILFILLPLSSIPESKPCNIYKIIGGGGLNGSIPTELGHLRHLSKQQKVNDSIISVQFDVITHITSSLNSPKLTQKL